MIHRQILALLIGIIGLGHPLCAQDPDFKVGPKGFPLPADSTDKGPAPGGGGKIFSYEVPRGKTAVEKDQRAILKKDGWTIDKDETSPRGAIRLEITKNDAKFKLSIIGNDEKTALILTVP